MKKSLAPFAAGGAPKLLEHARSNSVMLMGCLWVGVGMAGTALCQSLPVPLAVDAHAVTGSDSNANGILEPGETVQIATSWTNASGDPQDVTGTASGLAGPPGPIYSIDDASANFGTVDAGATADCNAASGDCYLMTVGGTRPSTHWDAVFKETLSSDSTDRYWTVHVGASFSDVPVDHRFYPYIETIFHNGVTAGCAPAADCPNDSVTRAQMAVFLLKARLGASHVPPPANGEVFADVHVGDFAADWIEELAGLGITAGCGNGNYCPLASITRAQMAVFLLKSEHGSEWAPPACTGRFADVPCPSTPAFPYSDWIEQLSLENITGGCSPVPPGGLADYCPGEPVTRGEMAVFLVKTFGLILYGPPQTPSVSTVTWIAQICPYPPTRGTNWYFSPAIVHVHAGDTVQWVWLSGLHSTTSGAPGAPDGLWDSGWESAPFTFSHTFTEPGTFSYYCKQGHVHWEVICPSTRCPQCYAGPWTYEAGTVIVDP